MSERSLVPHAQESGTRLVRKEKYDALIIGAGPGGLASAMLLARAGLRVRIVERAGQVGGRTSAITEGGFRFDLGPTFFHVPEILERLFRSVGRRLEDELDLVRLDPSYRVHFGTSEKSLLCGSTIEQMEESIGAIAPDDARNFRAYLDENRKKWEVLRPIIERPQNSWRDWLPTVVRHAALLRPWRSMDSDHQRFFKNEHIRRAFSFQSKYLGMSPFECPAMFSFHSAIEHDAGIYHPIGGCAAISEAMGRIVRDMDIDLTFNDEVKQVLFEGRRAIGVQTADETIFADNIFINADFAHAMKNLVPNELRRSWSDEKMKKKRYSCSTFMMYLGIEGRYDDLTHHTLYLPDNYDRNTQEIEEEHVLSDQPSFYVQNASITDPTLAPRGMSTLYILVPVTHEHPNVDWARERERYRRVVLDQLPKVGLTDLERRIRFEKIVTPADWGARNIHRGAVFNLAHTMNQMLSRRPQNKFKELDGVYLVGGGTHPGSGLFTIFESARISVRQLLESRGMPTAWMEGTEEAALLPPARQGRYLAA